MTVPSSSSLRSGMSTTAYGRNDDEVVFFVGSSSRGQTKTTPSRTTTTTRGLASLLVLVATVTVGMNLLFVVPLHDIPIHENPYFFSDLGHMHAGRGGGHGKSSSGGAAAGSSSSSSSSSAVVSFPDLSDEEGRQYIVDIFHEAGVELTPDMESQLPSWSQVREVVGSHPYILGLDQCQAFQDKVPPLERMMGSSGMFNSGTNLVTHLLKQNCEIPERRAKFGPKQSKESYGMRWQVPWGKHTPAKFRLEHATQKASDINKEHILPVVTIRHPYSWFKSMCKNPYTAKWSHSKMKPPCPNLRASTRDDIRRNQEEGRDVRIGDWNPVTVKYANNREDHHENLAALWNDWYGYFRNQRDFPYVMVRMEDLVFYPKETTRIICECAGGEIRKDKDSFSFIVDSAKADSPGHDKSTGIFAAWVKYSKRPEPMYGFTPQDYEDAKAVLDKDLMESLGYHHPPPS